VILPLVGRSEEIRVLDDALDRVRGGERLVVAIEGAPGSGKSRLLDEWVSGIEGSGLRIDRATGFPAGETHPGLVARELDLTGEVEEPRVLVVDDLHWVDPTSIGLIQRFVAAPGAAGALVVLTHGSLTGARALALQRLGDAAGRRGGFVTGRLEPVTASDLTGVIDDVALRDRLIATTGGVPESLDSVVSDWVQAGRARLEDGKLTATGTDLRSEGDVPVHAGIADLARPDRKLIEAAALAGRPVSVALGAELLGMSSDDVLELGERLTREGHLRETPEGFGPVSGVATQRTAEGMGEVRRTTLLGELGDAVTRLGVTERDPGVTGTYFLRAGRFDEALPLLAKAGLAAAQEQALGEALPLLEGALTALERTGRADEALEGRLRLARAQCYQRAGWDALAAEDLEAAIPQLSGVEKVHALGWAARVADDRQLVREAERYAALAELEAIRADEPAMLGSLLTLHGRELSRLGFANEAHATLDKGNRLLELHGSPMQRFRGRVSASWIAYDEGRARDAEASLAELALEASRLGGTALSADIEGWWARALFQSGQPDRALEVRQLALDHADQSASTGPVFLAHMALAEGAEAYGQYEEALTAAGEVLELVQRQLPVWTNAAFYLRARALVGLGRFEEAAQDVERAINLCPPGIDGWRWRLKCRVLQLRIDAALDRPWPRTEGEELTDQLLQAQWFQPAGELMTIRAQREGDQELARDAAALAVQLGTPMAAAEAAHAGSLWDDPGGRSAVAMVKTVGRRIPDAWRAGWRDLPWVAPALAAPELTDEDYQEASTRLIQQLDAALMEAGLGDADRLLSPAQRRSAGLVRRRRPRRRPAVTIAAAVAAIVVLGGLGGLVGTRLLAGDESPSGPPTLEETVLGAPQGGIVGASNFGGDIETYAARAGVSTRSGVPRAAGYFWRYDTDVPVQSSPSLYGQFVLVGSGNDLHAIDSKTGDVVWVATTQGAIDGPPTVALLGGGEGGTTAVVYFGNRDGAVLARDVTGGLPAMPDFRTGGQVVSSPLVVDGVAYVGDTAGTLYAIDAVTGQERWSFATGGEIRGSPAFADGVLYVASMDGKLYALDASTGVERCASSAIGPISTTPVVAGDKILVGSSAQDLWEYDTGCRLSFTYRTGTPVEVSPAVSDGVIFVPSTNKILAIGLGTNEDVWVFDDARGAIRSSPVVASGVLYVGSDDGYLYAVNVDTGETLWKWKTDGRVRSSPAVADGAIFFGSFDGIVYAVGGR
jgi:outer membrane protein assembly factor BamB/tetratricopeptide (TPR) repeat protein